MFFCGVAMILAVGTLSGCNGGPATGSVFVEVRPGAQGASSYDVRVFGPDQEVVTSREVFVGSTVEIEGAPFGWVKVEAVDMCTIESELSRESPKIRLVIDTKSCTSTD